MAAHVDALLVDTKFCRGLRDHVAEVLHVVLVVATATAARIPGGAGCGCCFASVVEHRCAISALELTGENAVELQTSPKAPSLVEAARGNSEWLLVVDDDAPVRDVTARLLRHHGYQVTEATGPREALAELERHPARFSLLATDVVMPEMSGVELAEAARRLDGELPLLFMSGYEPGLLARADTANVLQKPYKPDQLLQAVGGALRSASARARARASRA